MNQVARKEKFWRKKHLGRSRVNSCKSIRYIPPSLGKPQKSFFLCRGGGLKAKALRKNIFFATSLSKPILLLNGSSRSLIDFVWEAEPVCWRRRKCWQLYFVGIMSILDEFYYLSLFCGLLWSFLITHFLVILIDNGNFCVLIQMFIMLNISQSWNQKG